MMDVLQRYDWTGQQKELGELFVLRKANRRARCLLLSHQLGWELKLVTGAREELPRTQVCRTQDEVLITFESWKAAMQQKGWT